LNFIKSKLVIITLILFSFLILGCVQSNDLNLSNQELENPIKIGAVLELTGTGTSDQGQSALNAIRMAIDEENLNGGVNGRKIVLYAENSACDNATGALAAKKLIEVDKVSAIIGDICDGVTATIVPMAKASGVLLITPGSTAKSLTEVGAPTTLRTWFTEDQLAKSTVAQMVKRNVLNIGIIYMDNAWGEAQANAIKDEVARNGGISVVERVQADNTDFRTILDKMKLSGVNAYYLGLHPQGTVSILSQMKEKEITSQVYAHGGLVGSTINQGIDNNLFEGLIASFVGDSSQEFISAYVKKYGYSPGITADSSYDTVKLIIKSMRETNSVSAQILSSSIKSVKNYAGASGMMSFDEFGEANRPISAFIVEDRKLVLIE
jgi:branched-chain amino acid transport system substrate-binding protein